MLVDASLHHALPPWLAVGPLVPGIAITVAILPLVVLAMRPCYAGRWFGYTT